MNTGSRLITLFVLGSLYAAPAQADPLAVTSGFLILDIEGAFFALAGDRFSIGDLTGSGVPDASYASMDDGGWPAGSTLSCRVCEPGERFSFGWSSSGDVFTGPITIDGVRHPNQTLITSLMFAAPSVPLPTDGRDSVLLSAPFRFRASIRSEAFSGTIVGRGMADAAFYRLDDGRYITEEGNVVSYSFTAAPVPEPGSILLLGSGIAGLIAARRKTRRSS